MNAIEPRGAIFVGRAYLGSRTFGIYYGQTGKCLRLNRAPMASFTPDGMNLTFHIPRAQIYVPSIDKTRHCPKP